MVIYDGTLWVGMLQRSGDIIITTDLFNFMLKREFWYV